ncbi:MAG: arginine--tRNA ligase [Candidatus Aminicenantes bacterium]|nr:arginine--tRNA ligase [Candidatus Aminicenantes bacterium]
MKFLQENVKKQALAILKNDYEITDADLVFSLPGERKFGDLSTNLAFVLAKKIKIKPLLLANAMAGKLQNRLAEIESIQVAGGGFINFFLRRDPFLHYQWQNRMRPMPAKPEKIVVEHTSINPNKAAHIGHLRNSCLGDILARCCRFLGHEVEVQNYIDDTGIQIADVVWGLLYYQKKDLAAIKEISDLASYLWNLYAEVNQAFATDEKLAAARREVHKKIEEKINPEYEACLYIAQQVLLDHIRTMARLDIQYDLLARESDVIGLDFFKAAAAELTSRRVMTLSQDPEKQGCLVIRYEQENIEKIIVRSNQTITYVGKDIAYNLWKFGLLPRDFHYRPFFTYPDNHPIYMTAGEPGTPTSRFGQAGKVFNVIDVRQSYLQNLIAQVLLQLGHVEQSRNFIHFSYEMVAMTPGCVREMGLNLTPEEENKPYVEVSGRKGRAVKADDLIDQLIAKSRLEIKSRNPGLSPDEAEPIARAIAVAALRYFMVKFNLNSVIAFDFKEALNFEGDSGPYLQYTLVRLNSILKKAAAAGLGALNEPGCLARLEKAERELYWEIILNLSLLQPQVEYALANHELSSLAAYAYGLCQKFNHYYHLFPVLAEKDPLVKDLRLTLISLFKNKMEKLLQIMGISVPDKM